MRTILEKKIPVAQHHTYNILDAIVSTVLVFICMIAFKPSFISVISLSNQIIISAIISTVVMVVLLFKCFAVAKMERSGKWNLKMDLITLFIVFGVISAILLGLSPIVLKSWLKLPLPIDGNYVVMVVGFVHLIGLLLYFVSVSAKHVINGTPDKTEIVQNIDSPIEIRVEAKPEPVQIVLEGKNHGEQLTTLKENLVCISTNGHYIDIFILEPKKDELKKIVFRNTILFIANSLKAHDEFIQCHRSHLININHVENVLGTSKKMEVKLKSLEEKIPVSRAKASSLAQKLKSNEE